MLIWGGLRGALSMVLALAVDAEFPHRELIVTMTFGVVLLSIVLQGVTTEPLLRALKLVGGDPARSRFDARLAELFAVQAALDALAKLERQHLVDAEVAGDLRAEYEGRSKELEAGGAPLLENGARLRLEDPQAVRRHLLEAEKDAVGGAYRNGLIDEESRDRLRRAIDARRLRRDED